MTDTKNANNAETFSAEDEARLAEMSTYIEDRVSILKNAEPYLIDMSSREATLSSYFGHTLADKIELHDVATGLGFKDFGLSNFFGFPTVTDRFVEHLLERGDSLDPFFTTIAVEPLQDGQPFPKGPAAQQTIKYGIPNIILLVEINSVTVAKMGSTNQKCVDDLRAHIREYRKILPPQDDRRGRIYIRFGDALETYDNDPKHLISVIKMLGTEDITGILFEDVKGTRFPFETYALVRLMRQYNPKPRKILAHPHLGNGTEDAATLECILAGGDGVWSGFTPQAAQGGHGSSLMFLTNLMRAGNPRVAEQFDTVKFQEAAERMWRVHDHSDIPPNTPVVGERAYLYVDKYFEQTDQPRDLDPALIGRTSGYQLMPSWAPTYVIGKRLHELGYEARIADNQAVLYAIRAELNARLIANDVRRYDDPENLRSLVDSVLSNLDDDILERGPDDDQSGEALTQRYK